MKSGQPSPTVDGAGAMKRRRVLARWLTPLALVGLCGAAPQSAPPQATFTDFRYEGNQPGSPKPGPGEYANPIIAGSRSDPTIVRVGQDYYLSNTSFGDWPGAPIWRSRDLVNWKLIGHAFTHADAPDLSRIDPGWQGVWTNDLKYRDGWFYLSGICYSCGGIFAMRSRDPTNWPKPTFLPLKGIDASFFFDDDGRSYITHNGAPPGGEKYVGDCAIWLQEIDVATMTLKGPHTVLVDGGTHPPAQPFFLEGEHLFKKDGRYYLTAAQGGTNENHSQVVFRSDTLRGAYVQGPDNPILTQVGMDPARPNPVANAGHADFVQTQAGDWWAVFLGARPYTGNPLDFATGRDTFLLPVTWRDGWPTILPAGKQIPMVARRPNLATVNSGDWPTAGDFVITAPLRGRALSPRWSLWRSGTKPWWRPGPDGLALTPRPVELGAAAGQPSFVGLRLAHSHATATVSVRFAPTTTGDRAGLAVMQDERRWFLIAVAGAADGGREIRLIRRTGPSDPASGVTIATARLPRAWAVPVRLKVLIAGPSERFAYSVGASAWQAIGGEQDASILTNRVARGFTGVMIGPTAIANR